MFLQVCLHLSNYTDRTEPRMIKDKFFLELLDTFMVADDFRPLPQGLRHAQQIGVVQSDFVVSLPTRISSCGAEISLSFINPEPESLSFGIAVSPRSLISVSAKRVSSGSF